MTDTRNEIADITASELRGLMEGAHDIRILDVRTPAEFETAHIPGAYNIPLDHLADAISELRHVGEQTVVVCQTGNRASTACVRLDGAGVTGARRLEGGMSEWERVGGDVFRGTPRWSLERQVRLVAGGIVLASILASVKFPAARFVAGAVGAGLTFAAVSNTCAMGTMLAKLPYNRAGRPVDVEATARRLRVHTSRPDTRDAAA